MKLRLGVLALAAILLLIVWLYKSFQSEPPQQEHAPALEVISHATPQPSPAMEAPVEAAGEASAARRIVAKEAVPGGSIGGRVFDAATGLGVASVRLDAAVQGERRRQWSAVTDANGEYRMRGLAPGQYTVFLVTPEGYATPPEQERRRKLAIVSSEGPGERVDFELKAGLFVFGRVRDAAGVPLEGIDVDAEDPVGTLLGFGQTDSEGNFHFILEEAIPELTLEASGDGYENTQTGPFTVAGKELRDIEIIMQAESAISGHAYLSSGAPAANHSVFFREQSLGEQYGMGRVKTDAAGAFRIGRLSPGSYDMLASSATSSLSVLPDSPRTQITLKAGEERRGVRLVVDQTGLSISGRVLTEGGQPLERFKVAAVSLDGEGGTATSGKNGAYSITGLSPGLYEMQAGGERLVEVEAGATEVDLILAAPGRVEGQVLHQDTREPVIAFQVAFQAGEAESPGGWVRFRAVENPEGRFHLEEVPAGDVTVFVRAGDLPMARAYVPGVGADAPAEVEVLITPGAALEGRVVTQAGQPVADAQVSTAVAGQPFITASTGANGSFRLEGLHDAPHTLVANHPAHGVGRVQASAGQREEVLITLSTGSSVQGIVTVEGIPEAGIPVLLGFREGDAPHHVITDSAGSFHFDGLESGNYELAAMWGDYGSPGSRRRSVQLELGPGELRTVDLEFPELSASLSGVLPETGEGAYAVVFVDGNGASEIFSSPIDPSGVFSLDGIPAGDATVSITGAGGEELHRETLSLQPRQHYELRLGSLENKD